MCELIMTAAVRWQDQRARLTALREDDAGLTLVAYALGAAVIVVPLVLLLAGFGSGAADSAQTGIDSALP